MSIISSLALSTTNMVANILLSYITQVVSTVGAIFLFGFLIALCNRRFYSNFGDKSRIVCYITGFIGTPVHELSHALFCLIFGHKIVKIKLFQINAEDGTLGYVQHTYNPKNIYHKIGNFFIGVAPIIVISALLYLFAYLIMPATLSDITMLAGSISFANGATDFFYTIYQVLYAFFTAATTWQWWVFVIVGMFFALHMTLSGADIKGALSGLLFVLSCLLIIDVILGLIGESALASFDDVMFRIGAVLDIFLLLALIISIMAYIMSFIYRIAFRKFFF